MPINIELSLLKAPTGVIYLVFVAIFTDSIFANKEYNIVLSGEIRGTKPLIYAEYRWDLLVTDVI